jgi:hypothetical protein
VTTTSERYIANLDGAATGEEEEYGGRIVGLRTMKEGLQRHRLFWMSCAALGLLIGAVFHLVIPTKYVAVTTLYLTEPATGVAYTVADDVNLLETKAVEYRALSDLHIDNRNDLPGSYHGVALGSVLLEIKADGRTPAAAVRWAKALARAFFSVRAQTLGGQTNIVVSSLNSQAKQLEAAVQRLNNAISVLSSAKAGPATANQVADMVSERGTDETQLTTLQNQVQQDLLEQSALNKGSYVLDPAQALLVHTKRIFAEDGLSGLVAGLAIGVGGVVVGAVISDRPRRRAEVAALLGAPVELSLSDVPEPNLLTGGRVRGQLKRPGAQLKLAQRRLREKLGQLHRPALALVGVGKGSAGVATAVLAGTALSLAAEGKRVVLVDMAKGRPMARLFRVRGKRGAVSTVTFQGQYLGLVVAPEDMVVLDAKDVTQGADAILVLADADPAVGSEHLRPWAEAAVVMLRAGKASDLLVEAAGQMLRDAGVPPVSAVMLGTDERDETFGSVDGASKGW